jgi:NADH:ubiquinone oxidoreductase subunit E
MINSHQRVLSRAGLTNFETSYSDYIERPMRKMAVAYCTSILCLGGSHFAKIKKQVQPGKQFCPDCGHALFYKEENRR